MKYVLVLNQFALPRDQSGGTRHADLFGRIEHWAPTFIVGNRNYNTQLKYRTNDHRFTRVPIPSYKGASLVRMTGWGLYAVQAVGLGLLRPHLDIVYASSPNMLTPVAGWAVARLRRVPLVVEVRDLWPESIIGAGALARDSRLHRALVHLETWIYEQADRIVAVTPGWESHFESLGIPLDKVTVVPNGTEISDFRVDEDRARLRAEFDLRKTTAVYAGAHGPANALGLVLDAAENLPDVDFALIGSGTDKARLQRDAHARGLSNVRFLDPMKKSELARFFAAADIGVHCIEPLPILQAGMSPNKLFDYMAAGLPIVSNAGAGLRTIVQDGEAGHTGDPMSLIDSIRKVASASPQQISTWRTTAMTIVEKRFSRTSAATLLGHVLDSASKQMKAGEA